jgi:uncharacterized protein YabE (DUF348 family)/3D (Asp-Asp-Asp) domain-containing protein
VQAPTKTVTLVRDGHAESVETHALTVADVLLEEHIARSPDDALDIDPNAPVTDGETIHYRAAVPVTLVIDGTPQQVRTTAQTVGELLAAQHVTYDAHDAVAPAADQPIDTDAIIDVEHVNSWVEKQQVAIAPHVHHVLSLSLPLGTTKVVDPGQNGIRETAYLVVRDQDRTQPLRRTFVASRVIRAPRMRTVAAGLGEYTEFASLASKGFLGTVRLARAAIAMVATAYTANCSGCSGITKMGFPAGHGIVAVDPRVIPLGTHLFIPGYGAAIAGDTGGAIQGKRIDLGFNSSNDAMQFGRRPILVYVVDK